MLQPFEIFTPRYLDKLIALKKRYLVSQSYTRGAAHVEEKATIEILLTDHEEENAAAMHYSAVKKDRFASVLDLTKPAHVTKLREMMQADSTYRLFWAVVPDLKALKKRVDLQYRDNMKRWIEKNTTWRISGEETIRPELQVIFGGLFITLKRGAEEVRIKFEQLERS